jgi:hypothetical protein
MTPLFKKLNFKAHTPILILNAPENFVFAMEAMKQFTTISTSMEEVKSTGFILVFVTMQQEVDTLAPAVAQKLEGDGVLWFCYPKGSSKKYKCNFNRDTGWNVLGQQGFEGVRMVAVDEDWSALRFRKVQFIKTMTRSFAQTEEGKQKALSGRNK